MSMPRSGAGAGTSTWIFYNDLLFLADHIIELQIFNGLLFNPSPQLFDLYHLLVQGKQSPLSPIWNPDLNCLYSSPSSSLDSEITNTSGTNIFCETEEKEGAIKEASKGTASAAILKAMAASVHPSKTVPPKDPVKKRKRDSEKIDDVLSQSSKDVSFLATSLGAALEKFGPLHPVQPALHLGRSNMSSDTEAMLGFVAVALNRVPEEEQVSCVMDIVTVVKRYTKKQSENYESETSHVDN